MTPSDTEVENPFSVVDAATAAVLTPTTAPAHPDNANEQSNKTPKIKGDVWWEFIRMVRILGSVQWFV